MGNRPTAETHTYQRGEQQVVVGADAVAFDAGA